MSYLNDLIEFHNTSALLRKKIWSFYIHLANSLYKMKDLDFVFLRSSMIPKIIMD